MSYQRCGTAVITYEAEYCAGESDTAECGGKATTVAILQPQLKEALWPESCSIDWYLVRIVRKNGDRTKNSAR